MRNPFVRFFVFFVLVLAALLAGYYFTTRRPTPIAQQPLPPLYSDPVKTATQPLPTASSPPPPDPFILTAPPAPGTPGVAVTAPEQANILPAAGLDPRGFVFPLEGLKRSDIQDTFNDRRGNGRKHEATDIMAPRGTPVHAIDEGNVVKLFSSKLGGFTVYQFDNRQEYCFYYAHLDRYATGLKEGMLLRRGDVLGYVGSTGDAATNAPHLHIAIFKLGPEKHWWQGTPINLYPLLVQLFDNVKK